MNTIKTENVGFSTYSVSIPTTVDRQCLTAEDTYHGLTELLSSPTVKVKKKGGGIILLQQRIQFIYPFLDNTHKNVMINV